MDDGADDGGSERERRIRELVEAGDHNGAAALAVGELGDEVYGYVLSRSRDEDEAGDVFAQACTDLLTSLPAFQFRCSIRTWFYRLARTAGARYRAAAGNRTDRRVALSQISEAVDQVRTRTHLHMRSEIKDGFRKLREQLDPDEQQLLTLRIDRDLAWNDIAEIIDDIDDPGEISRAAARLRQEFQKLKDRLRDMAVAEGLIPPS
jgi:RNA polymerase sigma-70 factor (ECF subfamily)